MLDIKRRSKLQLIPIEYDYKTNSAENDKDLYGENVGRYPLVFYKGISIEADDVLFLILMNDGFLPKLELKFHDKSNKMFSENYPLDNDLISIFIRSENELTMPVRMDFKIVDFNPIKSKGKSSQNLVYYLKGELNVDFLYNIPFRSDNGTSFDILYKLSKESLLGFATNIDNTNDKMTWINSANFNHEYLKNITSHSFKNDKSFLTSYIDFYYNFCFVDIQKELISDISTAQNVGNDSSYTGGNEEDNITKLKLSNHPDYNNTNMYIDKFNLLDEKTKYHLTQGYKRNVKWYNKNENNYNDFLMEPILDNDGDKIYKNNVITNVNLGKLDNDNVHENYLFAQQLNSYNLLMLQKTNMLITLTRPNFSLNRFQKILVELFSLGELDDSHGQDSITTTKNPKPDNAKINDRLSGEWIITGIRYTFSKKDGNVQEITLSKRSLNEKYTPKK